MLLYHQSELDIILGKGNILLIIMCLCVPFYAFMGPWCKLYSILVVLFSCITVLVYAIELKYGDTFKVSLAKIGFSVLHISNLLGG
jgi:hypothetical protein